MIDYMNMDILGLRMHVQVDLSHYCYTYNFLLKKILAELH